MQSFVSLRKGTPFVSTFCAETRIYLILFAPHAFVLECQERASGLPSPLVFRSISTDFTPTPIVPATSPLLKSASIACSPEVEPRDLTDDLYLAHCTRKFEIRISKFETISKCSKYQTFLIFDFSHLNLFRISDFVLRISLCSAQGITSLFALRQRMRNERTAYALFTPNKSG